LEKPVWPKRSREIRPKDFDGYFTIMAYVLSQVDRCHAAGAQLAFELVPISKRRLQTIKGVGHR
jgi:hypothetical protein